MKTVFVGAVETSHAALVSICAAGHAPDLVMTLPPHLSHRHSDFVDLEVVAKRYDVPVSYIEQTNAPETIEQIEALKPDLILVIGWSQICGAAFRAIPRIGCIGFHPSALPRLRGRGVIPWTVVLGERNVGSSLFWLGEGADDGPIAAQARYAVDPETVTARELYNRSLRAISGLLPPLLEQIALGDIPREPQPQVGASVCARRRPEDGLIDWSRSAAEINRLIRASGPPYPGAFTSGPDGSQLVLTQVRYTQPDGYYIGLPGQIQAVEGQTFTVACGDGRCLDILEWSGADIPPALHSKLGKLS
ncbi:methionyl-tRNA formyltransferase [Rhodobacteraceae bacterium B1Z28]|uniref:Methionyl-tRNA formyltransferase n=1 Tax=Ruegeria haliotis TaxID=2747601 RepID=A0ABX2PQQ8_9RHOB|nr:formyltransferase family protein [Ruegeria haliotis]NVO56373.1 methionyl-tRNA formyltransferase [Ruegeria haliotis]